MWKGRGMIKERGCREDVEGKRDDKGKGGCEGKGMIKGRGCREDVEGKGDGQAMLKIRSDDEQQILVVIRRLVATLLLTMWHMASVLDMSMGGGEFAHLSLSPLCLFMDPGLVHVCFRAFAIIWVVVFHSLTSVGGGGGCSSPFVDGGGHALPFVVAVGARPHSLMAVVVVVRGVVGVEGVVVVVG